MGLDSVELVMALEEEFQLEIPNSDAARLETPGLMLAYVMKELQLRGEQPDEDKLWSDIKDLIVDHLAVRPEQVTRTAYFVADLGVD